MAIHLTLKPHHKKTCLPKCAKTYDFDQPGQKYVARIIYCGCFWIAEDVHVTHAKSKGSNPPVHADLRRPSLERPRTHFVFRKQHDVNHRNARTYEQLAYFRGLQIVSSLIHHGFSRYCHKLSNMWAISYYLFRRNLS